MSPLQRTFRLVKHEILIFSVFGEQFGLGLYGWKFFINQNLLSTELPYVTSKKKNSIKFQIFHFVIGQLNRRK